MVDGLDGAGKTTMIKAFADSFYGKKILVSHDPGGTKLAEKIRELVLSEDASKTSPEVLFGLMWASRFERMNNQIIPALKKGITVISDRFDSSTFAYQVFGGKAHQLEKLFWETRKVFLRGAEPDLYIFLDVDPSIGIRRLNARKGKKNYFDKRKLDFHKLVREGFCEFFKKIPHVKIDSNRPLDIVAKDFIFQVKKVV